VTGRISTGAAPESTASGVAGPVHLGDVVTEDLATLVFNLSREVWALRDRQLLLERTLEASGVVVPGALDEGWPDEETEAALEADRELFVAALLEATTIES
jgi:hypothetical protein